MCGLEESESVCHCYTSTWIGRKKSFSAKLVSTRGPSATGTSRPMWAPAFEPGPNVHPEAGQSKSFLIRVAKKDFIQSNEQRLMCYFLHAAVQSKAGSEKKTLNVKKFSSLWRSWSNLKEHPLTQPSFWPNSRFDFVFCGCSCWPGWTS